MAFRPLGSYEAFRRWNASRPCGADDGGEVTFGAGVVANLVAGIARHPDEVVRER